MALASNRPETPFFVSQAIARAVAFYVQPPRPDRCDALVAELSAILARGQAALDARAINLAER
ncbi:hypothetical protein [Methylocapsa palsarum]|uniref:Uncharacterized protein n=1 Tax=Methylocapsa palsarum TaxID=1612308 RepID=A0A1I3YQG1_9HYPH|nr:hypothetical protein [Methylocapsa palsarum]SFK34035.1 hypothetical protein SAMN05444581_106101 [Methylocapsa palsarum]